MDKIKQDPNRLKPIIRASSLQILAVAAMVTGICLLSFYLLHKTQSGTTPQPFVNNTTTTDVKWEMPAENTIPAGKEGEMIRYGKELLVHTARYFGPQGSIAKISNGMSCQNCHLEAGGKLFGNNYASFMAAYPKVGARSGKLERPDDRIIQCFERSLAGRAPDTNGREVQAILAYMKWLAKDVKAGQKLYGAASGKLPYPNRAADPSKGLAVYTARCQSCHGKDGAGVLDADGITYTYPPLWGPHSYNDGAGMYRMGNLAAFVKNNMPFGTTYKTAKLSNDEAWDVAAFINSQPRPHRDQHADWPDLHLKPIDAPFGPYIDKFTETQHKYGPFGPIKQAQQVLNNKI